MPEERKVLVTEAALFSIEKEAGFLESLQHRRKHLKFFLKGDRYHHHGVHVYEAGMSLESRENGVNDPLENCRCRTKSKRHYLELVQAIRRDDDRLLLVVFLDFNLPEAALKVHRREKLRSANPIQGVVDTWQQPDVLLRNLVQLPVNHSKSQAEVFLLDKDERRCPGAFRRGNDAVS